LFYVTQSDQSSTRSTEEE